MRTALMPGLFIVLGTNTAIPPPRTWCMVVREAEINPERFCLLGMRSTGREKICPNARIDSPHSDM